MISYALSHIVKTPIMLRSQRKCGFALVIALGLMAFVLLLLLSMTTLVQVESRSARTHMQRLKAEQAALLSLNIAIGKLQETAGLDQRVTAPAEALAGVNGAKQLTGVWRSWEGRDHQSNGLPIEPDYASKINTGDQDIDPSISGAGRFLGWLVSDAYDPAVADAETPPDLVSGQNTVALVGAGTVGVNSVAEEVHVTPTALPDEVCEYAWWIGGENTKAFLPVPEASSEILDASARLSSSRQSDPAVFDVTDADKQEQLGRVTTRSALDLLSDRTASDSPVSEEYFHDLTVFSRGLLTNTATGGWRRDLSLMSERWEDMPESELPFFTLAPGVETAANKFSTQLTGLIYPWSSRVTEGEEGEEDVISNLSPVSSWDRLMDYMNYYKNLEGSEGSVLVNFDPILDGSGVADDLAVHLIPARITWLLAYHARFDSSSGQYEPRLVIKPIVTMWNPYNVAIRVEEAYVFRNWAVGSRLPLRLKFSLDNEVIGTYALNQLMSAKTSGTSQTITVKTNSSDTASIWKPGEVRVYSCAGDSIVSTGKLNVSLEPGLRIDSGRSLPLPDVVSGAADSVFKAEVSIPSGNSSTIIQVKSSAVYQGSYTSTYSNDRLSEIWEDQEITNSGTLDDLSGSDSPFIIANWGIRLINAIGDTDNVSYESKGAFETSPFWYAAKANTPQEAPHDWLFIPVNDWADSNMPTADDDLIAGLDEAGYIGSGLDSAEGLARLVVSELPTRPLISLGQLQHFDHAYCNRIPPHFLNPIGNSHASSQIMPNAVFINDSGVSDSEIFVYDHSYVGNHLLFDDWFVSSIAPEMEDWSKAEARDAQTVYEDFVSGEVALPNRAYQPATELSGAAAETAAEALMVDTTAWHDVASEIEVEGMFNINSTSVEAWSALLRNMNDEGVAELTIMPDSWDVGLTTGTGQPVSRTTIAGPSNASGNYANILATHKRLSEEQIEALAEKIVEQIKLRGPFLSLSEFVNRRLVALDADDVELAKSGVIEAALNALSELGEDSKNPYQEIQAVFGDATVTGTLEFPEAAEGNVAYAFPGWIRQADILRPIAPVISARDDTFVIRAYGEYKGSITGEKGVGAWCEAVVQRRAEYVDTADAKTVLPSEATLTSEVNKRFGRRFSVVSFRWLSPDEV